jgi:maltose O-acetyltransferase
MIRKLINKNLIPFVLSLKRKIITYDPLKERYLAYIQSLVDKGLKLGKNVTIETSVAIDSNYPYLISIGDNCSLAAGVSLHAHDDTPVKFTGGYAKIGKIDIKENCFISRSCIILPGVTIGPNVLVAAGSVVNKDIPPNSCVAGVPARFYAKFDDFIENTKNKIETRPIFSYADLHVKQVNKQLKKQVRESVQDDICFVKGKPSPQELYDLWNPE